MEELSLLDIIQKVPNYRVYYLTLCQNRLITLFIPEIGERVSMLGSFLTLASSMCASLDGGKIEMEAHQLYPASLFDSKLSFDVKNGSVI